MCNSPSPGEKVDVKVTFPHPFDKPPVVMLTTQTSVPDNVNVGTYGITTDGFTIVHVRSNTTSTHVDWIAFAQ